VISDGRILIADCGPGQGTDGWAYFDYPANVAVNMNRVIHDPPVHMGVAFIRAYRHYDWEIGQTNLGDFYVAWNYAAPGVVWYVGPSYGSPVQPKIRQMVDGSAVAALTAGPGLFVRSAEFTPLSVTPPGPQPIPPTPTPQPPIVVPAGVPRLVPARRPFRLYVYQQPGNPTPDDYDWIDWPSGASTVTPSPRELQIYRDAPMVPQQMIDFAWSLVVSGVRPNVRLAWQCYPQQGTPLTATLKDIRRAFLDAKESGLPWAPVTAWYRGVTNIDANGEWGYAWSMKDVLLTAEYTWQWFTELEGDWLHAWIWTRAGGADGLVKWPELMALYEQVVERQREVGRVIQPGTNPPY